MPPLKALVISISLLLPALAAHAEWKETVLAHFPKMKIGPCDGLIMDSKGNLYGTAAQAGIGRGIVFEMSPPSPGKSGWLFTTLHTFHGNDGEEPYARLVFDPVGNLYGTTRFGGGGINEGVVFRLSPAAPGRTTWTESVIYRFGSASDDGFKPLAPVAFGEDGALYGTTSQGGPRGSGTVFKLTPSSKVGTWQETILHAFSDTDGGGPVAGVAFDAAGNLYGTSFFGGRYGEAFKLTPPAKGLTEWPLTAVHYFDSSGAPPEGSLTFDAAGNLYGTTSGGGKGFGTVFKLTPPAKGKSTWTETTLRTFAGPDGGSSLANVIFDKAGHLYGTTEGAPQYGGTVFELIP
jgi:uncharacterized repeat protein (TIGR03803 family)